MKIPLSNDKGTENLLQNYATTGTKVRHESLMNGCIYHRLNCFNHFRSQRHTQNGRSQNVPSRNTPSFKEGGVRPTKGIVERSEWKRVFSLKLWHIEMQAVFWKKLMGDTETFKLVLFFIGNGCTPILFTECILLAQYWAEKKAENRARQINFIVNNVDRQNSKWFYFDIDYNKLLHLNGEPKQQKRTDYPRQHELFNSFLKMYCFSALVCGNNNTSCAQYHA